MKKELNINILNIVNILTDGQYHDGNSIGEKLNMSRTAVWKIIKRLKSYDIPIDSIKGKGYALLEPLILLELNKIKKKLIHDKVDIHLFENIDSTNNFLKNFKNNPAIKICIAEKQSNGKGRLSREWYSPFGKNIYLSCLYPFQKDISELAGLSLITSLAIIKTLKDSGIKHHLFVKWPNDIIYENKKISGSLIEIQAESNGMSYAVIGVGINVNMQNVGHNSITQPWTSMSKIFDKYVDRNEVVARLINHLINYLHQFNAKGFSLFMDEWMSADCLTNQIISVKNVYGEMTGKVQGINEQGHLMLQLENGAMKTFSSGDTSIIKR